jgi:hypothetical protein
MTMSYVVLIAFLDVKDKAAYEISYCKNRWYKELKVLLPLKLVARNKDRWGKIELSET